VVEDYLATFGDLPDELDGWVAKTNWVKAKKPAGRDGLEVNSLWIMLELGDVQDVVEAGAWSKEGRMWGGELVLILGIRGFIYMRIPEAATFS